MHLKRRTFQLTKSQPQAHLLPHHRHEGYGHIEVDEHCHELYPRRPRDHEAVFRHVFVLGLFRHEKQQREDKHDQDEIEDDEVWIGRRRHLLEAQVLHGQA